MDEKNRSGLQFETECPPVLTEKMLKAELEKRTLNRQTALLAAAGILLEACFLLISLFLWPSYPVLSILCAGYLICSVTGGGILAVAYHTGKERFLC